MANFRISGVPIVDIKGKLVGILTNRDLRFETRLDLPISERMTGQASTIIARSSARMATQTCVRCINARR